MQVLFSTPEFSHSLGTKETFQQQLLAQDTGIRTLTYDLSGVGGFCSEIFWLHMKGIVRTPF